MVDKVISELKLVGLWSAGNSLETDLSSIITMVKPLSVPRFRSLMDLRLFEKLSLDLVVRTHK